MVTSANGRPAAVCFFTSLLLASVCLPVHGASVPQHRPSMMRKAPEDTVAFIDSRASFLELGADPNEESSKNGVVREELASQNQATVVRTDTSAAATVVRKSLEAACRVLNKLEAKVDALESDSFSVYKAALAAWRDGHPGEQPACRVQQLSASLCKDAAQLAEQMWSVEGGSSWDARVRELMEHELNQTECKAFAAAPAPLHWNPAAPSSASDAPEDPGNTADLDDLISDPDYEALYARARHRAAPFGPAEPHWQLRPQGNFRTERVEHLSRLRILRKAVPGMDINGFQQVLTFGGGSGDAAATLFDLGFKGTQLIYDHPAMLLMQRHWLRYSGVPAMLGEELTPSADAVRGKVIMESSLGQKIFSHIDTQQANASLFQSTNYFTQEDMTSFEKIRPVMKGFGVIQFDFQPKRRDVDTQAYLRRFVDEDLAKSHNVLTWRAKKGTLGVNESYHLLAVLKNGASLVCLKELNCMPETLHSSMGRRGNVVMQGVGKSGSPRTSAIVSLRVLTLCLVSWVVSMA